MCESLIDKAIVAKILFILLRKFANHLLDSTTASCFLELFEMLFALVDLLLEMVELKCVSLGLWRIFREILGLSLLSCSDVNIGKVEIVVDSCSAFMKRIVRQILV